MRSNHPQRPNSEALFRKIYQAAKAGNSTELQAMTAAGIRFKIRNGIHTPVMLLASQRDIAAVTLLMQFAHQDDIEELGKDAVQGYAHGGHKDLVDQILADVLNVRDKTAFAVRAKALLGYALRHAVDLKFPPVDLGEVNEQQQLEYQQYIFEGYAASCQNDLIKAELARIDFKIDPLSDIAQSILKGYALSGNAVMVDEMLDQLQKRDGMEKEFFDEFVLVAIYYYAVGGWVSLVNDMIERFKFTIDAMRGYAFGCHLKEYESLLRLLTCTANESLRTILTGEAAKQSSRKQAFAALEDSNYLLTIMSAYHLDYDEARKFLAQGERGIWWLLQGPQMVRDNKIPMEVFLHISSYVLDASRPSVIKIHSALNQRLLTDTRSSIRDGWHHRLIPYFRNKNINKRAELEEKSELRGNFYNSP